MIPAELARATVRNGELIVKPLGPADRARAIAIAAELGRLFEPHMGKTRQELEQALAAVPVEPRERALLQALSKLACDHAEFETTDQAGAAALRAEVFLEAARERRALPPGESLDRRRLLGTIAERQGLGPDDVDARLFSDLRGMERLLRAPALRPERLLEEYELSRLQAVLLKAVRLRAVVQCSRPGAYRTLFGKLKFRRLLYTVSRADDERYVIDIDGPFSLFESVTKYGLSLALVLPALLECDRLELGAELRWGAARRPVFFRLERHAAAAGSEPGDDPLPDELEGLLASFRALQSQWTVEPARSILDLPGAGVCVPDLLFTHASGARVFFELMGFWSRDAVWRRIELVQAGLEQPILFALSSRLRVSEAMLDEDAHSALYVYKSTPSARAVLTKLEALRSRAGRRRRGAAS